MELVRDVDGLADSLFVIVPLVDCLLIWPRPLLSLPDTNFDPGLIWACGTVSVVHQLVAMLVLVSLGKC